MFISLLRCLDVRLVKIVLELDFMSKAIGNNMIRKVLVSVLGIVVGVALAFVLPNTGLSSQAAWAIGILVWAIIWWISAIIPDYLVALIMAALFVIICQVPTETVLSSFAGSTWWLLVAAFGLGLAMQKSGLMARMAKAILRKFPNTYSAQILGFMVAGTVIGPFIPSLSVKCVMLAPLSMSVSDSMGYERKSKQADGLFLAMFTGIRNIGPAVISASIVGYAMVATLPSDVQAQFDMVHWFVGMLPWFVIVFVLNFIAIVNIYKPRGDAQIKQAASDASAAPVEDGVAGVAVEPTGVGESTGVDQSNQPIQSGQPDHPDPPIPSESSSKASKHTSSNTFEKTPLTKPEKQMTVIMACCVALWVAEPLHGIPSHIVAICALVATCVCKVLDKKDLRSGIAWDNLIFMGIVFGLAAVFSYLGIDTWIIAACEPAMSVLAQNPYTFVLGIAIATILLRFLIISEVPFLNIFMAFMVPLALTFNISPWVVGVVVYATISPWFFKYQNVVYLSAFYATDGKMVKHSSMAKYCFIYLCIAIIGLLASVPYWQLIGIL